jgi:hypothetical protein
MKCPLCKCEYEPESNVKKSDKDTYLEHWGYTLGTPEAEEAWKIKESMTKRQAPMVQSDINGYISQVDGSWIDSKSKHREHLKRHRMIEVGNDVPMQQKAVEMPNAKERKRAIGEIVYNKLKY